MKCEEFSLLTLFLTQNISAVFFQAQVFKRSSSEALLALKMKKLKILSLSRVTFFKNKTFNNDFVKRLTELTLFKIYFETICFFFTHSRMK